MAKAIPKRKKIAKSRFHSAVFLDRDGTILNERGYLAEANRLKVYPSAIKGLKALSCAGFKLVVLTNQSGVGRGLINLESLHKIHRRLKSRLGRVGVRLGGIYYCPHKPDAGCGCRKPKPGMARRASRDLRFNLKRSYVVGDQLKDLVLAKRIGGKGVLVLTGAGRSHLKEGRHVADKITANMETAARWIMADQEKYAARS